jgi:hypothetical protein
MFNRSPHAEPRVAMMVITDGRRDCIERMMKSYAANVVGQLRYICIIDDSGDPGYQQWLHHKYSGTVDLIVSHMQRIGFGETVRDAWTRVPLDCDYVLHAEDDFSWNRQLILADWIDVLRVNHKVVSITALRQSWSQAEQIAGGFIPMHPGVYHDKLYYGASGQEYPVIEHKRNFSTNPCIYGRWVIDACPWPESPESEGKFSFRMAEINPEFTYLIWGKTTDEPLVHHFGQRSGTGY